MSANASVLGRAEAVRPYAGEKAASCADESAKTKVWDGKDFEREQVLGLVRRSFLVNGEHPGKHIVFSAAEAQLDVTGICKQVARCLASETPLDVALVVETQSVDAAPGSQRDEPQWIKSCSNRESANFWRVPRHTASLAGKPSIHLNWIAFLLELRAEFAYSVIQGPPAAISSEAALLGKMTDGVILVLGARTTRRAAAANVKRVLQSESRILGAVLSERTFPIPERLYRRL
jgi:hypothetical protein